MGMRHLFMGIGFLVVALALTAGLVVVLQQKTEAQRMAKPRRRSPRSRRSRRLSGGPLGEQRRSP